MGGSMNWSQLFGGAMQPPQYQDQTFSNDQIFQAAKGADQGLRDAYKNELLAQLRAGSYKTPEGVYSNVLNAQSKQRQMDAYNAEQAAQQQQSDSGYYSG